MHQYKNSIIAHIGPMFGGKTSGLLSDIRKMKIAGYKIILFKPKLDIRYSKDEIVNHNGDKIKAINIESIEDIIKVMDLKPDVNVIAIDEFQFIKTNKTSSKGLVANLIEKIYKENKTLIISGLDLDSDLFPYENIKEILPYATHIIKHKAVCTCCGNDATVTYCKINKDQQDLLGGSDIYEPLCIPCYFKQIKEK